MKKPMCSPCSSCCPQKTGSLAESAMSAEIGTVVFAGFCSAAVAEQPRAHPDRDPVEHDRRDHFVGADRRLQEAGDACPHRARRRPCRDHDQDVRQRCHTGEVDAEPVRDDEPDEVLTLAADVEHPAAERERDGKPAEDERRRLQQRLRQVVGRRVRDIGGRVEDPVEPGAVEDVAIGEQRVVTGGEDDEAAHEECDHDGRGRNGDPAGALLERDAGDQRPALRRLFRGLREGALRIDLAHAAARSLPPSISRPSSSSDTSPVWSPTISPS